ncbi:hypothetical protein E2C01_101141 [Portunus trituberculatus]|uniref:Immunoglobulin I-set domain-containing protein n=1 Tax=Portunus trituberculatus TaxID=210409 RepID=A0A5B7K8T5_PORTR|nr:hypothetical protein [Portunus trituberculatus]
MKPHSHFLLSVLQGGPVEHRVTKGIILQNQTLVLQNIRREAAGLYTCAAVNIEGEGESQPVNLRVKCEFIVFMQLSGGYFFSGNNHSSMIMFSSLFLLRSFSLIITKVTFSTQLKSGEL